MRSTTIELATYLLTYCKNHSHMVDAEFALEAIHNTGNVIRLNDAQEAFEKSRNRLIGKLPEGVSLQHIVADFLTMIHEAANDTTDQSE